VPRRVKLAAGPELERRLALLRHARLLVEVIALQQIAWALCESEQQPAGGLGLLAGEVR
jgi:hypothetical protein